LCSSPRVFSFWAADSFVNTCFDHVWNCFGRSFEEIDSAAIITFEKYGKLRQQHPQQFTVRLGIANAVEEHFDLI